VTLSLQRQIDAVRLEVLGIRAQRKIRTEQKQKWPETEIGRMDVRITELEAVIRTLEWLQKNEHEIKRRLANVHANA
jgi:hypothetical protein